ncbi:MAG: nucleotide pyrophosphohydrolase [Firmicutes bacterium]|jgi:NTP pyrophosphatase (non-canonical NTP hydrolase)|nr:nucleotide pyrophosphohydrolase [Bacillota bacterium]
MQIAQAARLIHENAREKGFWDSERNFGEAIALIHSEASEALEAYRESDLTGIGEELADIVIRTLDLAQGLGYDIEEEMIRKMAVNKHRPRMHGKRC